MKPALVLLAAALTLGLVSTSEVEKKPERRYLKRDDPERAGLPFSEGVLVGDTLYLAGTIGLDPETGLAPDDVEREARLALDSIKATLAQAGMTMDDLIYVQVFCSDLELYDDFNQVYRSYFKKDFPARAFIGSGPLLRNGRFEIQGIAVRR